MSGPCFKLHVLLCRSWLVSMRRLVCQSHLDTCRQTLPQHVAPSRLHVRGSEWENACVGVFPELLELDCGTYFMFFNSVMTPNILNKGEFGICLASRASKTCTADQGRLRLLCIFDWFREFVLFAQRMDYVSFCCRTAVCTSTHLPCKCILVFDGPRETMFSSCGAYVSSGVSMFRKTCL